MTNFRTLVLRHDYNPISLFPLETIKAEDAITRVLNGTCDMVADYGIRIKTQNPKTILYWPSVIARRGNDDKRYNIDNPPLTDEYLYYRDHCICMYCDTPLTLRELTLDHVQPISKGGRTEWTNSALACTRCNSAKGNNLPVGKWTPRRRIYKPTYWDLIKARKQFPITVDHETWKPFIGEWNAEVLVAA